VYERTTYESGYIAQNLVDYASPKNVTKVTEGWSDNCSFKKAYANYGDEWMETVQKNLELRFNYNYKTTDFSKWKAELLKTFPSRYKERYSEWLDWWRDLAKRHNTIITASKIVVEPSSIYMSSGKYYVRCYVRFKVSANTYYTADSYDQNAYIFATRAYFPNLKLNQYYDAVIDMEFGDWAINSLGNGATVTDGTIGQAGY
jgi:hypothetical protein